MAVTQKRGGVEVDGLAQSIRALGKLDGEYKKEAVQVFRDAAKDVQARAQKNIGVVGRYPNNRGMIGRSATSTGAGVKLRASKYPWAYGAEFGEVVANIPQHGTRWQTKEMGQSQFKRRTFGFHKPPTSSDMAKNTGGYMIQPVLRARLPKIEEEVSTKLVKLIDKAMRKAGVPRGR